MTSYADFLEKHATALYHSGVKGMKWGVRHNPVTKGEKKAFAAATKDMNNKYISQLNNTTKYAGKDLSKSAKLRKEYEVDSENLFTRVYAAHLNRGAANEQMKHRVVTGVILSSTAATIRYAVYVAALSQADTREKAKVVNFKLNLNELGQIDSIEELSTEDGFFDPEPLAHISTEDDSYAAFLEKHASDAVQSGIKGMRWGVRRKPGPDGTVSSSPDAVRAAQSLASVRKAKTLSVLSDADLDHLNKRLGLEKKLSELDAGMLGKSNRRAKRYLDYGTTMNKAIEFANSPAGQLMSQMIRQKSTGKHAAKITVGAKG